MSKKQNSIDTILEDVLKLLKEIVSNHSAILKANLSKSLSLGRDILYSGDLDEENDDEDIEDVDSMVDSLIEDILDLVEDSIKGKININIDSNQDINIDNEELDNLEELDLFEIEDDEYEECPNCKCNPCECDKLDNVLLGCKSKILLEDELFEIEDDDYEDGLDITIKDKILLEDDYYDDELLILIEDDEMEPEEDNLKESLKLENKKYKQALNKLHESIKDVKMLNTKMKFLNKILTLNKLNKKQQDNLIDLFDSVDTLKLVRRIYLTFNMSIKRQRQKALTESKKQKTTSNDSKKQNTIKESVTLKLVINELLQMKNLIQLNQSAFERIAQIAGISKK